MSRSLRAAPGTYALLLRATRAQRIGVGRLGVLDAEPGTYVYVGSAHGPGGVRARVRRHARTDGKARHWHADYLRAATTLQRAWITYDADRRECAWAQTMRALPGATLPMHGFGASDCGCPSHLVRFAKRPSLAAFRERVVATTTAHAPIHVWHP